MTTYPLLACQALLLAVFGLAAVSKLTRRGFGEFVAATGRLLPARWSRGRRPVALGVLAAELATVCLLAWPAVAPVGFGMAAGLGTGFSAAVVAALRRGERGPCRCLGATTTPLGGSQLARNGAVVTAALAGLLLAGWSEPVPVGLAGVGLAALAGLALAGLVVRIDDLVALFAPMPT